MKKSSFVAIALFCLLVFASPGWSLYLNDEITNIGVMDPFERSAVLLDSGAATELAWVRSVLGPDITLGGTYDVSGANWNQVRNDNGALLPGVYAINFQYAPEYFLVKIGAGASAYPHTHYLFANLESMNWGVIELSTFGLSSINVTAISHVGEYNPTAVPEPGTILLLGFGLIGLAAGTRRCKK